MFKIEKGNYFRMVQISYHHYY